MTVHLWLHQHLEKGFVSDQSYYMYMHVFSRKFKNALDAQTLDIYIESIKINHLHHYGLENYEVVQEFRYCQWSKSLMYAKERMGLGGGGIWYRSVFLYYTYWMYYVYMYNMQNFDFLFRYSLLGETILRYFDNLHSVNICRKKVLLSLKEREFDGNTDSAKIEEIFLGES